MSKQNFNTVKIDKIKAMINGKNYESTIPKCFNRPIIIVNAKRLSMRTDGRVTVELKKMSSL